MEQSITALKAVLLGRGLRPNFSDDLLLTLTARGIFVAFVLTNLELTPVLSGSWLFFLERTQP